MTQFVYACTLVCLNNRHKKKNCAKVSRVNNIRKIKTKVKCLIHNNIGLH